MTGTTKSSEEYTFEYTLRLRNRVRTDGPRVYTAVTTEVIYIYAVAVVIIIIISDTNQRQPWPWRFGEVVGSWTPIWAGYGGPPVFPRSVTRICST